MPGSVHWCLHSRLIDNATPYMACGTVNRNYLHCWVTHERRREAGGTLQYQYMDQCLESHKTNVPLFACINYLTNALRTRPKMVKYFFVPFLPNNAKKYCQYLARANPGGGARDAVGSEMFSKFSADNASKSLQKSRAARARDNHTLSYLVLLMYQLTILQLLSRLYRLKIVARALRDRCDR